ncbi:MAG: succinyl-diaminopimelate desuccinylase [Psychrobium sp.]|nr:succinyl-diaminopimelate desuccinylase [Psychrobium sp.]
MNQSVNDQRLFDLSCDLLSRPSVTPEDCGCQDLLASYLTPLGFNIEAMDFSDTKNIWARKGTTEPLFCFAGHTDVVPVGNESKWLNPPFSPKLIDGMLHGRGAADMKGSIAAMTIAVERFVLQYPDHNGSIAFLITSDEEGPFINGTTRVIDTLEARNEKIQYCIVGEPSSTNELGDIVKNGRRGSLTGDLTIIGKQGHVAYPHLADNPIHKAMAALDELASTQWDQGNASFPPTSLQISNINGGTGVGNVIPGELKVQFNLRYSTELTAQNIIDKVNQLMDKHQLEYDISWTYNGLPFLTEHGHLLTSVKESIKEITGRDTDAQTTGGTSDGRFIAPTGAQLVELGPVNATIHQVNECVKFSDLELLTDVYQRLLEKLLLD